MTPLCRSATGDRLITARAVWILITSIENQTSIFSPQLEPFGFPPLGWAWFRRLTFGPDRRTARAIATQAMTAARLCVDQIAGDAFAVCSHASLRGGQF